MRWVWALLGVAIAVQVTYPLTAGPARTAATVGTVLAAAAFGVGHARVTRGPRWTALCFLAILAGSAAI
jgi:hypothetical protein